jgi:Phage tail tube protein
MSSADLVVLRFIEESTIGVTPDDSVKALGTLTATVNFANAETVTIGTKVYTFQTTLTNVDGHVDIGATLTASLLNLLRAINNSGGVPGTDYAASTEAHPSVSAISSNATTLVVRALTGGTSGNSIATTETCTNASWGAATLASGANSTLTEWEQVRFTGESLNFNIENTKTAEIRPDRTETDLIQTSASGGGDVNFEMSYGSFRDWLQAVLCSSWTGSGTETLENGILLRTYTVQKHFQDMTPAQYHLYRGTAVEGLNLNMEIGKIVEGSWNLMSFGIDPDTGISDTQIGGSTFAAVSTTSPMNAVTNLQDFTVDGVPYSGCISSLKLQIKNNIRAIRCLGSLTARNMKLGTIEVTGDMEFYFNEGSNYRKFVKGTEFDFSFALEDNAGNRYLFELPRCKFESGEVVAGGKNTDVMFSAKWRGLYDANSDRVMQLSATPA